MYGLNVLLYIGKADRQTFGTRIAQESWYSNRNAREIGIYVGRLAGEVQPTDDEWSENISQAEKLLIYSHVPACNSQFINLKNDQSIEDLHVLNWGSFGDLMSEVSGRRWAGKFQNEWHNEYNYQPPKA
ncbi:hypothetical protein [Paenibacillus sinopodophylli]|uniref:hypothetical protein n=1 Tax=Paenibacillus sinopodophylli TaxID=1837342 RepID=UPI001FECE0D5|nr:hypothetical protein [Paenibacillus sinopodophylli]